MVTSRRNLGASIAAFAFVAAATVLASCSGSQTPISPLVSPQQNAVVGAHLPIANPAVKDHCPHHGDVRVKPCAVDFTASAPGPDTVVVRFAKDKKGTLSESDNCGGPSGIATVAQGSGKTWTVTAGSATGSCTAEFDRLGFKHGKKLGWAKLSITNSI